MLAVYGTFRSDLCCPFGQVMLRSTPDVFAGHPRAEVFLGDGRSRLARATSERPLFHAAVAASPAWAPASRTPLLGGAGARRRLYIPGASTVSISAARPGRSATSASRNARFTMPWRIRRSAASWATEAGDALTPGSAATKSAPPGR